MRNRTWKGWLTLLLCMASCTPAAKAEEVLPGCVAAWNQPILLAKEDPKAEGWRIMLASPQGVIAESQIGSALSATICMPAEGDWASLRIYRQDAQGETCVQYDTWELCSPKQALISQWIAAAEGEDGTMRRADNVTAPGQCKRYLINLFARVSEGFALAGYPNVKLAMPEEHHDTRVVKRAYGAGWKMPDTAEGNPFYEMAAFDYDSGCSVRQNREAVYAFLAQAQAGDVLQMMATYNSGNRGTHTALITRNYDAVKEQLQWADSNFKMRNIDGIRYAFVVGEQVYTRQKLADWLLYAGNGATLYRLRDDLVVTEEDNAC